MSDWLDSAIDTVKDGAEGALHLASEAVEGAEDLPVIGAAIGVGETAYHAVAGVGDMVEGDWDGAAHQMGSMANSAANVATGGLLGMAEAGFDATMTGARAAGATDEEAPSSENMIQRGLQSAGEWLGDKAYELVHGDDSNE